MDLLHTAAAKKKQMKRENTSKDKTYFFAAVAAALVWLCFSCCHSTWHFGERTFKEDVNEVIS